MRSDVPILVATDNTNDAELVRRQLNAEFTNVQLSTDADRSVADFERCKPEVLVLAFNTLEKAERYYLGLYRLSTLVHALPHRTVILCNKDDVRRVYDLCKREYFDDYILFWPMTHDTPRLPMAVIQALRQKSLAEEAAPDSRAMAIQASRIAELETQLAQYVSQGEQHLQVARQRVDQTRQHVGAALDQFSRRLLDDGLGGVVEVRDVGAVQREIEHLKSQQVDPPLSGVAQAVNPMYEWAARLGTDLSTCIESARTLQSMAERHKRMVLLVDDDPFQHQLLAKVLANVNVELSFAASGLEGLAHLRKRRPDLVLMDIGLPDLDGVEVARRIRSSSHLSCVPVIMITGHSEKAKVVESMKAGACDFVVKPFDRDTLLLKLNKHMAAVLD